jgi:hypothetical protein
MTTSSFMRGDDVANWSSRSQVSSFDKLRCPCAALCPSCVLPFVQGGRKQVFCNWYIPYISDKITAGTMSSLTQNPFGSLRVLVGGERP